MEVMETNELIQSPAAVELLPAKAQILVSLGE